MIEGREAQESADGRAEAAPNLARQLGLFDATMIVMGGIIGAGIFINPHVVAQQVHTPALILGAWAVGGLIALGGAFVYAELAARRPAVGGQYAYIREAYHPAVAFIYGWGLLLVIQSGGMAAVAVTFARYFIDITHLAVKDWMVAALALGALTIINCLGVRAGSAVQNFLMVLKIAAIVMLVFMGLTVSESGAQNSVTSAATGFSLAGFGAALVPVMFAYGGWQTANFIAGEVREPRRNLPRGLLIGVAGVVLLYLAVNFVCVHALGVEGLANTSTPASEVMRLAMGERGSRLIAIGIAISTFGFLSQSMLTAPRVYFAMAEDRVFFKGVAYVNQRTRVPAVAIALQGAMAIVIAVSGQYNQILNYVVSVDFIFFGLTATCIFVIRRRDRKPESNADTSGYRMPGHPVTTVLFVLACWLVVASTIYKYPKDSLIGLAILAAGIPVFYLWRWRRRNE